MGAEFEERGHAPVLMIGLDAAELTLVEQWMAAGDLPELAALRKRGTFTKLRSTANWLVGSPWSSFYTSTTPAEHGLYHYLLWRPDLMTFARPTPDWLPLRPFWRELAAKRRVVAMDIPLAYAPGDFGGIEISGWATHETLQAPASNPPSLMSWVQTEFGKQPLGNEESRLLTAAELLDIRDQCLGSVEKATRVAETLMRRERWDLFLLCLAATHRGGHQLWDQANLKGDATPQQTRELEQALKSVYVACDAAVGRLVREAGPAATVMVFALHGMGPNVSRSEVLGEMVFRILAGERAARRATLQPGRPWKRLRSLVPGTVRSSIKGRLPRSMQDRLTQFWRTGGLDWEKTKAFAALCDLDGYVRVNLRGREAGGVVEPGADYEALCMIIADGLRSFVDADTGMPVVQAVARPGELFATGSRKAGLPDLMVRWSDVPAAAHRTITSPTYGDIGWPTPGRHPQGRSGNHRPDGFLIAAGDAVRGGIFSQEPHILDLAPSVYDLFGLPVPDHMHGRPLFRREGQ